MRLKSIEINGFKSFAKKTHLEFESPIVAVVGPNGSGKSNVVESFRFVLGEQSMKSMRGKAGLDLIFKGSKTLPKSSRAGVTIYFNNSDKVFKLTNENGENIDLNYDTISISREVYSDGLNKYILNGSEVRLKDINNLLASVNIGSSGHHIISQGEADRILNASSKDRREMIEDALGLKIYQYKMKEAERKLEHTVNNMKEVSLLRRENAPHLNFLKKQVEKFEKAKSLQVDLLSLYMEYLKRESVYLNEEKTNISSEKNKIVNEISDISLKISDTNTDIPKEENEKEKELKNLERKIYEIRTVKSEIERKLGRIEGMIEMEEHKSQKPKLSENISISREEFESFFRESNEYLEEAMYMDILENIAPLLGKIRDILNRFASNFKEERASNYDNSSELESLKNTQNEILAEMQKIKEEETKLFSDIEKLKLEISSITEQEREQEREKFTLKVKHQELISALDLLNIKEENIKRRVENFENELKEGAILVGHDILAYKNFEVSKEQDENTHEEQKKKIERIKIKLEDIGAGGESEVLKEFEDVKERDQFLEKEVSDLEKSIESLKILMTELKEKIDMEFQEGIKKINKEFQEFFALMFGGGTGSLSVIDEKKRKKDEEDEAEYEEEKTPEQGIEINVSLPHKKVKELHALSGGERSLTSIALLFAMSQVNPPPFLILDETDAALDESNSRKFGDMLEKLSKHSQLVVVTHNRETMSRAGTLYGVTVGSDGASKLLSVKFDEAAAIAK
ncbi:MAG TPA: AAA family ATPase [Candidatus Paceibacterota bacterium]|nr:AAA family ATPase [Candidatus Paceibacterota bacterium]HPT18376.1 AAA family ATPase [Candidatus Paceibacterota bacterium]